MTNYEFEAEYSKLEQAYPEIYAKKFRKEIIAKCVVDLDKKWFSGLVKRIVLNPYIRLDIDEAARAERLARAQVQKTRENNQAQDVLSSGMTEGGLENIKKLFGSNDLMEAVKNYRKLDEGEDL